MRAVRTGAAVVALLVLVACRDEPAGAPVAAADAVAPAPVAQANAAATTDNGNLRARAERAMREGRMYAPAGDSAIEHWLAARDRAPGDATLQVAIIEMQPYLLIACEQAIAAGGFHEARRLLGLMERSTPDAPALPRLLAAIAAAEQAQGLVRAAQGKEREVARLAAEAARKRATEAAAAARDGSANAAVAEATPPRADAPSTSTASQVAAMQPPASDAVAVRAPLVQPAPAGVEPAAMPASTDPPPRMLSGRAPRYPMIAMNRRVEGSVQVGFTINADGSVGNARVLRAEPAGVFERAAVDAVEAYRFEPAGRSRDSMVTINFTLPDDRG